MREILFRGKKIEDREWIVGNLTIWSDKTASIDAEPTEESILWAVIPETVGQYTGLTDKNGKKIFEGDICQIKGIPYIDETPFVVEWNEEFSGWFWKNLDFGSATDTITAEIAEMSRVIGNIHDNPELLKGE